MNAGPGAALRAANVLKDALYAGIAWSGWRCAWFRTRTFAEGAEPGVHARNMRMLA